MNRLKDWEEFSELMVRHIKIYAEKQYKSDHAMVDEVGTHTSEDCVKAIGKYVARYGKGVRGNVEAMRDMFKIAHWAQFAYSRLSKELGGEIYKVD